MLLCQLQVLLNLCIMQVSIQYRLHTELKGQKNKALEAKNRLDVALKDVRRLNRRIGELEQQAKLRSTGNILALSQRGGGAGADEIKTLQQEINELTAELGDTKEQLQNISSNQVLFIPGFPISLC